MSKQEFLTLHFKRSKLFMLSGDNGTKRFITGPTGGGSVQVPAWVVETQTYQMGIKDGSIVNLTPPAPTIIYRDAPAKVVETQTYQMGIKDGSIVNLTPPAPTIIYRDAPAKVEAEVSTYGEEDGSTAEDSVEDPKEEENTTEDESPTDEVPKSRSRKKKKMSGPAGLIETTIIAQ
jgi:hypothetical protein